METILVINFSQNKISKTLQNCTEVTMKTETIINSVQCIVGSESVYVFCWSRTQAVWEVCSQE